MSALTTPTANHGSKIVDKHLVVLGKTTTRNLFTENEWKAYTPAVISGGTFPTSATIVARWRLIGSTLSVTFTFSDSAATGGASTGAYLISMPSGVILNARSQSLAIGSAVCTEAAGSTSPIGVVLASGTTSPGFTVFFSTELVAPVTWGNSAPAGTRLSTATGKTVTASMTVEIDPTSPLLLVQNN